MQTMFLKDGLRFLQHVTSVLGDRLLETKDYYGPDINWQSTAGVLMLLGQNPQTTDSGREPFLVLNKRSLKVRQPGDLCFPGGGMSPHIDPFLARIFSLPVASLGRWPYWSDWKRIHSRQARTMSILWATGLRESLEEMRLNPFGVKFLGILPPQPLVMFKRTIYPMVGWIKRQKSFFPNWEVEKVVQVSLTDLLNPEHYGRYRLRTGNDPGQGPSALLQDYPCFRLPAPNHREVLWGATFRITLNFLELVFGFKLPAFETLPVVEGILDETYLTGNPK